MLFDHSLPADVKSQALEKAESRFAYLAEHLAFREYFLRRFSVADAYLFAVLNWHIATPVELKRWPVLADYYARLKERPSICRALREEPALYAAEQSRHKAACQRIARAYALSYIDKLLLCGEDARQELAPALFELPGARHVHMRRRPTTDVSPRRICR